MKELVGKYERSLEMTISLSNVNTCINITYMNVMFNSNMLCRQCRQKQINHKTDETEATEPFPWMNIFQSSGRISSNVFMDHVYVTFATG